jgi:uncharacterized protein YxjI
MATESEDVLKGVELVDNEYRVVQALFRNKYKAYDASGELVLQGKQKMLKLKEEFPFLDGDGEPAFTVKAGGVLDVAGNYALIDEVTDETVIAIEKKWTMVNHRWKLRDPETEALIAEINSKSTVAAFLRDTSALFSVIPHTYEIIDADDDHVGTIEGKLSLKDEYTITIDDTSDVPKEAVVAAAMVIDALEGN